MTDVEHEPGWVPLAVGDSRTFVRTDPDLVVRLERIEQKLDWIQEMFVNQALGMGVVLPGPGEEPKREG